ncbi:uncharacterized protein LOC135394588 [Ornithodoros turicata]|uniref:uncharacterized protein LOC135394588 n=1 Tax=Ornithodoros turicata TaxID=34597 RepID=UPI003139E969
MTTLKCLCLEDELKRILSSLHATSTRCRNTGSMNLIEAAALLLASIHIAGVQCSGYYYVDFPWVKSCNRHTCGDVCDELELRTGDRVRVQECVWGVCRCHVGNVRPKKA